jgi:predicted TIM-barrel fold metal-dependent hydrolase
MKFRLTSITLLLLVISFTVTAQDGKDILLKDYRPVSINKIPAHQVEKARYPAIDMHTHVYAKDEETIKKWIKAMDACGIEKSVVFTGATGARFDSIYNLYSKHLDRFEIWCGFDYRDFDKPGYGPAAVKELERCVKKGARGVGEVMFKGKALPPDARDKTIRLPDDKRFDALFEKCAELKIPVNIHISEDKWMYEDISESNDGLMNAATWHIRNDDGSYSHEEMLERFGNTLKKHPNTVFVAAHLLNCCADLTYLGNYFDKYPNLYADISARFGELGPIPRFVKAFMEKYQDRIVYGTDMTFDEHIYKVSFRLLETTDEHFYETDLFGYHWPLYGFGLNDQALKKIYNETPKKVLKH